MAEQKEEAQIPHPEYKCWQCDKRALIPHPDRETKKHPYPEWSFMCWNCSHPGEESFAVLVCCECKVGTVEWWYPRGEEIWEAMSTCKYCYDDCVYCQSCYFAHTTSDEHISKKKTYKKEREEELRQLEKYIVGMRKRKATDTSLKKEEQPNAKKQKTEHIDEKNE